MFETIQEEYTNELKNGPRVIEIIMQIEHIN